MVEFVWLLAVGWSDNKAAQRGGARWGQLPSQLGCKWRGTAVWPPVLSTAAAAAWPPD